MVRFQRGNGLGGMRTRSFCVKAAVVLRMAAEDLYEKIVSANGCHCNVGKGDNDCDDINDKSNSSKSF